MNCKMSWKRAESAIRHGIMSGGKQVSSNIKRICVGLKVLYSLVMVDLNLGFVIVLLFNQ